MKLAVLNLSLAALLLVGVFAFASVPVHVYGVASLPKAFGTSQSATSSCSSFWSMFPTNGTLVNYYGSQPGAFGSYSYGFHLDNFSLSTAMSYWQTVNNGSMWNANGTAHEVAGTWTQTNEITTYGIYANVHSLTAANDNLSLANGEFIFSVNGSRDSQATVVGASLSASQYNSSDVALVFHAKTLDVALGPVLASAIGEKQYSGLNLMLSDFTATLYTDCMGKTEYSVSGQMSGAGALSALLETKL